MSSTSVLGILLSLLLLNNRFILTNGIPSHVFDDMDEDQWIPSYSLIKNEIRSRKPSGRGFIFDQGIRRDEDIDPPEVKEEDMRVVPEIEQRRLETIKNIHKLLDSSGEEVNTAIKSPLAFARLTKEFMQKERGEEFTSWKWDALASVCDNWLDALKYTTLDPKCYPNCT